MCYSSNLISLLSRKCSRAMQPKILYKAIDLLQDLFKYFNHNMFKVNQSNLLVWSQLFHWLLIRPCLFFTFSLPPDQAYNARLLIPLSAFFFSFVQVTYLQFLLVYAFSCNLTFAFLPVIIFTDWSCGKYMLLLPEDIMFNRKDSLVFRQQ